MIRIEITAAAYAVLARGKSENSLLEAQRSPSGGYYLWLTRQTLNKLSHYRDGREGYSEAIIRLASELEAA